jgi:hypothetical protein
MSKSSLVVIYHILLTLIFECFMLDVLKSTVPVFVILLYISFTDEHLFIRNKELGYPYSVYRGTYSYLPVHSWFLVGFMLLDLYTMFTLLRIFIQEQNYISSI